MAVPFPASTALIRGGSGCSTFHRPGSSRETHRSGLIAERIVVRPVGPAGAERGLIRLPVVATSGVFVAATGEDQSARLAAVASAEARFRDCAIALNLSPFAATGLEEKWRKQDSSVRSRHRCSSPLYVGHNSRKARIKVGAG